MSKFHLEIIAPERTVWSGTVNYVTFWTKEGSMGILYHRAPLLVALDIAPLELVTQDQTRETFAVHGGMLLMDGTLARVITDAAEKPNEIDLIRAQKSKQRAMEQLETAKTEMERAKMQFSVRKNLLRERLGAPKPGEG